MREKYADHYLMVDIAKEEDSPSSPTPPANAIIVFFGRPGAGKGSQSRRLAGKFGWPCLAMGTLLRELSKQETATARRVRQNLTNGQLMENEILAEIIQNRTSKTDCKVGYIIDGYPRNLAQARWLEEWSQVQGKQITAVQLSISADIARVRISRRRTCQGCGEEYNTEAKRPRSALICDLCRGRLILRDDAKIIEQRLIVYQAETLPLQEHYKNSGRLVSITADQPEEQVFHRLLSALTARRPPNRKSS
jgi:adenylate kinase